MSARLCEKHKLEYQQWLNYRPSPMLYLTQVGNPRQPIQRVSNGLRAIETVRQQQQLVVQACEEGRDCE